jgi:hypothetical protein
MKIKTDFPGANIDVLEVGPDSVRVLPQLRDTTTEWFYWAFCVEGAQGETWTFDFTSKDYVYLGYFGPAVSNDLKKWHWAGPEVLDGHSRFTYEFGPEDDRVYFAHNMIYSTQRFHHFTEDYNIPVRSLARTKKNRSVDMVEMGEGDSCIVLTSRHHCCESTGTYVMEGMLKEFSREPIEGLQIIAVPFMDIDGVIDGDQGKNRHPHDHNRDYLENPIYESTAALMELTKDKNVKYLIDLHSPWHFGGRNDTCFIVYSVEDMKTKYERFGEILHQLTEKDSDSMQYYREDDIDLNVEWNTGGTPTCSRYFATRPETVMSFTFETAYFGTLDNQVSQKRLVRLGENLAKAIKLFDANL